MKCLRISIRVVTVCLICLGLWQGLIMTAGLPPFLLPGPPAVATALLTHHQVLGPAMLRTMTEVLAGFVLGASMGFVLALNMAAFPRFAHVLRPILLVTQVIPIFAPAPILTLWLGYGMAPKILVTALICFFPVAAAFLDGLARTSPACLDLARVMGARNWRLLLQIRVAMALPDPGSGLTLAAIYAPVGAVVGEWVGGSEGLGAVMIHANGRMRIDLAVAALSMVVLIALGFHALVRASVRQAFARFNPQ